MTFGMLSMTAGAIDVNYIKNVSGIKQVKKAYQLKQVNGNEVMRVAVWVTDAITKYVSAPSILELPPNILVPVDIIVSDVLNELPLGIKTGLIHTQQLDNIGKQVGIRLGKYVNIIVLDESTAKPAKITSSWKFSNNTNVTSIKYLADIVLSLSYTNSGDYSGTIPDPTTNMNGVIVILNLPQKTLEGRETVRFVVTINTNKGLLPGDNLIVLNGQNGIITLTDVPDDAKYACFGAPVFKCLLDTSGTSGLESCKCDITSPIDIIKSNNVIVIIIVLIIILIIWRK